jgi:hypothetical protein
MLGWKGNSSSGFYKSLSLGGKRIIEEICL